MSKVYIPICILGLLSIVLISGCASNLDSAQHNSTNVPLVPIEPIALDRLTANNSISLNFELDAIPDAITILVKNPASYMQTFDINCGYGVQEMSLEPFAFGHFRVTNIGSANITCVIYCRQQKECILDMEE